MWERMSAQERVEAVRPLEEAGHAVSIITWKLRASKRDVTRICSYLRQKKWQAGEEIKPDWKMKDMALRDGMLTELCRQKKTAQQISDEFRNATRNAVIGRVKRLQKRGLSLKLGGKCRGGGIPLGAKNPRASKPKPPPKPAPAPEKLKPEPRKKTGKVIEFPKQGPQDVRAMIDRHLKIHGARRFARGECTDLDILRGYVAQYGYEVSYHGGGWNNQYLVRKAGRGRPRKLSHREFFVWIDKLRAADGLEPFLPQATG